MFYKVTLGFTTGATYNMTNVHVFKAAHARRAYFLFCCCFYVFEKIICFIVYLIFENCKSWVFTVSGYKLIILLIGRNDAWGIFVLFLFVKINTLRLISTVLGGLAGLDLPSKIRETFRPCIQQRLLLTNLSRNTFVCHSASVSGSATPPPALTMHRWNWI